MDELSAQMIGYAVLVLITLGSFGGLIFKISAPITRLQIAVEKLTPILDNLDTEITRLSERVSIHGREIDEINKELIKLKESYVFLKEEVGKLNGIKRNSTHDVE